MDSFALARLLTESLSLVVLVSLPVLAVGAAVGVVMGILQSVTQVQDPSVAFVPRLVAVAAVLAAVASWMGAEVLRFTSQLWQSIPNLVP